MDDLAAQSDYWLEQQGRVAQPVILREGKRHFEPISWDEAFAKAGAFLRDLADPNLAAFYTSGRTSNEAAFLYQLFGRMYGTNNFPDCSNLCHESSGVGLKQTMGIGKGAVQLDDFTKADAIFIIGQNPGTNHPRMMTVLQEARRRGAEIVVINPLRERALVSFIHPQEVAPTLFNKGTEIATVYLQATPGSDVAVLKGMMKQMLEAERRDRGRVFDHGFIRAHCTGFEELVEDLDATPWTQITEQSGLTQNEIRQATEVYIKSRATILCWAMGLTQHENAVRQHHRLQQPAAAARQRGPPRRRPLPGARPQQRAGRPHRRHRLPPAGVDRQAGGGVRLQRRRASRGWTSSTPSRRWRRGGSASSCPSAATSSARRRTRRWWRRG